MTRMSLQDRRTQLVQAAIRVIAREGVPAATTRAIVAEAGMPLASFHYAFESHGELMRQVIISTVEAELQSVNMIDDGSSLEATILRSLTAYMDMLRANPQGEQAQMELRHFALRSPEHRSLVTEMVEKQYQWVESLLNAYCERNNVIFRVPTRQIAIHLISIADGLTLSVLMAGDSHLLRATLEPLASSFAQYVRER